MKSEYWKKPAILVHTGKPQTVGEAILIAEEADYRVLKVFWQKKSKSSKYYIGRGKVKEIKEYISTLDSKVKRELKLVVNSVLKPNQAYNLMREFNVEVIDRLLLILEVFSKHAGSKEAKLQIELAKLTHQLPMLREWVRLSKIGELPGFLSSGGYKVESYYEMVKKRIVKIREELEWVRERRKILRLKRKKMGVPIVAITGYFSAGKTTLFNVLTGEEKPVGGEPFTTLSPKSKSIRGGSLKVILVDTVGFIDNVPLELIKAFNATLEEVSEADLILLVVDISEDIREACRKTRASLEVLERIGALYTPTIIVANKVDLLKNSDVLEERLREVSAVFKSRVGREPRIVPVSAKNSRNIDELVESLYELLTPGLVEVKVRLPRDKIGEVNLPITSVKTIDGGVLEFKVKIPRVDMEYFKRRISKFGGKCLIRG